MYLFWSVLLIVIITMVNIKNVQCAVFNTSGCGVSKTCIRDPIDCSSLENCNRAFTCTRVDNNWIQMELVSLSGSDKNVYVAAGFSDDRNMGNEPVTECSSIRNSQLRARFSFNIPSRNNERIDMDTNIEQSLLQTDSVTYEHGRIYCLFRQQIYPNISNNRVRELNRNVYLLIANGNTDSGLQKHEKQPLISTDMINLTATVYSDQGGKVRTDQLRLIRAHAAMMIIAWLILISTSILFARHFRTHWSTLKPMNIALWFHFHRTLNSIAIVLMIIAIICIFIVKEWRWIGPKFGTTIDNENDRWAAAHAMVGLLACCLAWFQPIMALFRCHPIEHRFRFIFNWLHRFTGFTAWILAASAIVIACKHFTSYWSDSNVPLYLIIVYLVVIGVVLIVTEVLLNIDRRIIQRQQQPPHYDHIDVDLKIIQGQEQPPNYHTIDAETLPKQDSHNIHRIRLSIFVIFIVIAIVLSTTIIIYIVAPSSKM